MKQQLNHDVSPRGRTKRQLDKSVIQGMDAVVELNAQVSDLDLVSNFPEVCIRLKRSSSAHAVMLEEFLT